MAVDQRGEPRLQMIADRPGIFLQLFLGHDVEHRHAGDATDRAAAGGGKESALLLQRLRNLPRGDDGAERMAVAHALGDGDDIRHDALLLEAPEIMPEPGIADLHFVGDAEAAASAYLRIELFEIAFRQWNAAGIAVDRFGDEARKAFARSIYRLQHRRRHAEIIRCRIGTTEVAAIGVRRNDGMHPVRPVVGACGLSAIEVETASLAADQP